MPESCLSEEERALLPLMACARPMLDAAEGKVLTLLEQLARAHPDKLQADSLQRSVQAALVRPVISWSQRTLILELGIARHYQQLDGDTPQERFADFVAWIGSAAGRKRLAQNYPTLQQDIRLRCQQSSQFISSMLRQIVRDWPRLSQLAASQGHRPGPLHSFTTQLGPRQNHGKSVTRLDFAAPDTSTDSDGSSLYYKPHSMALDLAYHHLLDWLAQQGIVPLQRPAAVLDCGTYGYMAQVKHQACGSLAELTRYYERFGGLVALTHALGSVGLHHDNVIAAGEWPVLINLETLLQPATTSPQQRHGPRPAFADTVLYSGLLPRGTPEGEHSDNTALFVPSDATVARIPVHAGTDQMKLTLQRVAQPQCDNLPRLANASMPDQALPWHHRDAICHGFIQTWQALMRNKQALLAGPLAQFAKLPVRAMMRPTQVYHYALLALTHPNYLDNDDQRERLVARLRPVTVSGLAARRAQLRRTPLLRCWPAERLALQGGDVPRF
ncbi:MAG: type 2 lantibiotic biosynthesis LanM family protein, partial [Pseudomonadota bacterium]